MKSAKITSKMYQAASFACISLCVFGIVANTGAVNDNGFESAMKFLTSAADPKTPLAMPYFLDEIGRTDGDPPLTPTIRRFADVAEGEKRHLVSKARHTIQRYDLSAAPSAYRETADGVEYRDPAKSGRFAFPQKWSSGRGAVRQPHRAYKLANQPKPVWEPTAYTSSKNYTDNRKTRREKEREREGAEVYHRQQNHFASRFPEQQPPQLYNNDKHQRVTSGDDDPEDDEDEDDKDDEDEDDKDDKDNKEFVPMRMYAQVRQYESESHLPNGDEEPNLRKIVKDSRIHTVYMEEGYEDGAYDHAGEEKHAEEEEVRVEHRRKKRDINASLTNVEIDTDFIGKHQYALGEPSNSADKKYPYYEKKTINTNSPLRYAQTIGDIPRKREGNMAFYEDSHARTKCDEVVDTVSPIPKDLDAGEETPEKTMIPNLPRLKKLGDKIDCFKIKFFGEEPLDNPLFKEETVGSPRTLFNEPEFKETASLFRLTNRTGKMFQPIAVRESGYPASGKVSDEDNENANENANSKVGSEEKRVTVDGEFLSLPEAEALHMRIARRRKRPHHLNKLYSGWQEAYRPTRGTTPPPPLTSPNVISEVYYKDQIKPSEQLNVFADVINHIQNMSRKDAYTSASEQRSRVVAATPSSSMSRLAASNTKLLTGHRKKLKTKYPVMKSTQQLYTDFMRRSKNNPSRVQNDVAPIVQEINLNVGTLHIPKSYDVPGSITLKGNAEPVQYSTIDVPLNKYLVPGMRPPLAIEKPMIYSDYQSDSILKRRDWPSHHRLARRKRATRKYSEIRRQPASRPQESEEDADTDDYVPHRPTNYHYDPDTDRIVYDKKPSTEKSVQEMIEEYFEEELEEPEVVTTKKPPPLHKTVYHKDVLNKANGKTLLDFLAVLKSDPSYKPIEDPQPTKEPSTTTTLTPESTNPPEFLKFLAKLHSSVGYKRIDNPEDVPAAKKMPKTTTTEAPIEEEETEEEPVQAGSVQNSPGGQFGQNDGLQIFDINDYLPKVKTYTPRTSIDYSKYKTIERTTSRHSLSSRYSEEDGEFFERRSQTEAPAATKYQTAPPRLKPITQEKNGDKEERLKLTAAAQANDEENDEEDEPSTTAKSTTTTSAPKIRVRGRQRPSTRPTRATTPKPQAATGEAKIDDTTSEVAQNYTPATHRPPSRVYPRRQRPKIRLHSTTPTSPTPDDDIDEDPSETRRQTIRRKSNAVPANHKPDYTPVTISKRMDDYPSMLVQRQARLVTPEIINYNQSVDASAGRSGNINPRRLATRYKVARVATQAASTSPDKGASTGQINNRAFDSPRGNGNIDRSDVIDVASGVRFIKDPNKRLYFYAPL